MGLFKDLDIASASSDPFHVDDGTYNCVVTSCKVQESSKGGEGLTFDYTVEEDADNPEQFVGRKISEWLTIPEVDEDGEYVDPEKGPIFASFLKRRLESLGVPEEEMNTVDNEDLLDLKVAVTVKTKADKQGEDRQNISKLVLRREDDDNGWG